jgi:predicted methyltransferase
MSETVQQGETPAEQDAKQPDKTNTPEVAAEEEFDKDRAMETIKKLREIEKQYKKEKQELERLKADEQKRKEAEMTEAEKAKARADELEAELKRERADRMRLQVAGKFNLPEALANRLQGETMEELEADAEQLAKLIPTKKETPKINATDLADGKRGETDAEKRNRIYRKGGNLFDATEATKKGGGVIVNFKQ